VLKGIEQYINKLSAFHHCFLHQLSLIIVDQTAINCDYELANLTFKAYNDGAHDTVFNATLQTFFRIDKMTVYIKVNLPLDDNDREYKKQIFSTSLDAEKALNGVGGNFINNLFAEGPLKSFEPVPKFPMDPVGEN